MKYLNFLRDIRYMPNSLFYLILKQFCLPSEDIRSMSKPNKLLASIETDIKIEKGLKILEFATQYYLTRTYLRNTPLNYISNDKKTSQKQQQQYSQLLAQLNQQIVDSKYKSESKFSDKMQESNLKQSQVTLKPIPMMSKKKTLQEHMLESDPMIDPIIQKMQSSESSVELPQSKKIPKPKHDISIDANTQVKLKKTQKQQPSVLSSSHKKKKKFEVAQVSKSSINQASISQLVERSRDKSMNSSNELNSEDFNSYFSETRQMKVISQANESQENSYIQSLMQKNKYNQKKNYPEYSLQQFDSINYGKISIGNSTIALNKAAESSKKVEPKNKAVEKSLQTSNILKDSALKQSGKFSFLDRSITEIHQNDSKSTISNEDVNQTQKSFLRHISDSFVADEKIKTLIKLENLELQEKHLLQRMQKRFQNCAKEINEIRSLNWTKLNLPPANIAFKRPNYAHCIQ